MVGLEIQILLEKDNRKEFLQAIELLSESQSKIDTCIEQTLFLNSGDDNHFLWLERWADLNALEDYLISDQFRSLQGAIEVLGNLENMHIVEFKATPVNSP
jgi:quinol monooxygenase YgiN